MISGCQGHQEACNCQIEFSSVECCQWRLCSLNIDIKVCCTEGRLLLKERKQVCFSLMYICSCKLYQNFIVWPRTRVCRCLESSGWLTAYLRQPLVCCVIVLFLCHRTKVASTHGNHNVYVTDLNTGKNVNTLSGHPRTPWCITFHPSSNQILASGCLGGQVRVWDLHVSILTVYACSPVAWNDSGCI